MSSCSYGVAKEDTQVLELNKYTYLCLNIHIENLRQWGEREGGTLTSLKLQEGLQLNNLMKECHMIESLILGSFRKKGSLCHWRLCLRMKEPCEASTSEAQAKSVCGDFICVCVCSCECKYSSKCVCECSVCSLRQEDNLGCCSSDATYLARVFLLSWQVAHHDWLGSPRDPPDATSLVLGRQVHNSV